MQPSRRDLLCGFCVAAVACTPEPIPRSEPASLPVDTSLPEPPTPPFSPCVEPGTAEEGWTRVGFDEHPQLEALLGHTYLQLEGRNIVIAHVEPDCFVALERPCTHEGVLIEYRDDRNGFVCPRHGAVYGWDGDVIAGPPPAAVAAFPCGIRDRAVWVLVA